MKSPLWRVSLWCWLRSPSCHDQCWWRKESLPHPHEMLQTPGLYSSASTPDCCCEIDWFYIFVSHLLECGHVATAAVILHNHWTFIQLGGTQGQAAAGHASGQIECWDISNGLSRARNFVSGVTFTPDRKSYTLLDCWNILLIMCSLRKHPHLWYNKVRYLCDAKFITKTVYKMQQFSPLTCIEQI